MSNQIIPISFALTPRIQSFLELRDALRCLAYADKANSAYAWLAASRELHDMFLGENNKKPVMPNIVGLFSVMQKHFTDLSNKHPQFKKKLTQACEEIDQYSDNIRRDVPLAIDFLCTDAWLNAYYETIRKQDMLGHKQCLPQIIPLLWSGGGKHAQRLNQILTSLIQAIEYLDKMLHAHAPWQPRLAKNGCDIISINKQDGIGLLIVGITQPQVEKGIFPNYSGNRQQVRLRFNQLLPSQPIQSLEHDFNYSIMMVPIS